MNAAAKTLHGPAGHYRKYRLLLPVIVTLATLAGMALTVDCQGTLRILGEVHPGYLALAALKAPLLVIIWTLRWRLVLMSRVGNIPFSIGMVAVLVRIFFNNLTPGLATGGEPLGAYYLARRVPMPFRETLAGTAAERMVQGVAFLIIMLSTCVLCLPSLPLDAHLARSVTTGLALFASLVLVTFYLTLFRFDLLQKLFTAITRIVGGMVPSLRARVDSERTARHLDAFFRDYRRFLRNPLTTGAVLIFTAVQWGLEVLQHFLIFKALGVEIPIVVVVMTATLVKIVSMFAVAPGGAGVVEAINFGLYTAMSNLSAPVILAETVLFRAIDAWLLWLVSGVVTALASKSMIAANRATTDRRSLSVPERR